MDGFTVRRGAARDLPFLWEMLYEAAYWRPGTPRPPIETIRDDDHVARYLDHWGRHGDLAMVAERDAERIGAAWCRLMTEDRPGYGFVAPSVPEVAIGVRADHRGRGAGTALLAALVDEAATLGFAAVSLSVEADNPAVEVYRRLGFAPVEQVAGAWTMRRDAGA